MQASLRLAVASGKGGTGKTLFATHLAWALAQDGPPTVYVDADVEEPNGHLLLHPELSWSEPCTVPVPVIERLRCSRCGDCVEACAFNAVTLGGGVPLFFRELCHGCGNCIRVCPDQLLLERARPIGKLQGGQVGPLQFMSGTLDVGEPRATPLIARLWDRLEQHVGLAVVDCPPGTSCAVVTAVHRADVVLLVTEPTPFGRHDLELALAMCRALGRPAAVVLNRSDLGDASLIRSLDGQIRIIAEMPYCSRVADANAEGRIAFDASTSLRGALQRVVAWISEHYEARGNGG
jgi:MinD superfamily P-loop ATPase